VDTPEYRAGWYPDPLGRFDHRWFDGTRWTADVSLAGVRRVDPDGIAPPSSATGRRVPAVVIVLLLVTLGAFVAGAVVIWSAVADFVRVAEHEVGVVTCASDGASLDVAVDVTNTDSVPATFTVFVEVSRPPLDRTVRSLTLVSDELAAGATTTLTASFASTSTDVECSVVAVLGPLPFGIDLGPVGVSP
jgi:hypothetical protein